MFMHGKKIKVCEFNASWDRTGYIWIEKLICDNCKIENYCLSIDSSEEEYGSGDICYKCIKEAFDKLKK